MTKQITKQEINKLDKHLQGLEDNWEYRDHIETEVEK